MAGDWIKMRVDLLTSPKVVRMSSALNADRFRTIGGLLSAWSLFDAHSTDGHLSGYSVKTLNNFVGWDGFGEAMEAVKWLIVGDEGLWLPEFDTHNGEPAKRRAQEADRKRREREGKKNSGKNSVQTENENQQKEYAFNADKKRTRGEERRGDINIEAKASSMKPVDDSPIFINIQTNRFETIGEEVGITVKQVDEWQAIYPGINIKFLMGRIQSWCKNNPKRRKTKSGMNKFIDAWLAREHNTGGENAGNKHTNGNGSHRNGLDHDDTSWIEKVYGPESSTGSNFTESGVPIIEGDFSCMDGGNTGSGHIEPS